ncbi:MAG: folylpolyglutamate synthase/dihydrofolate synthase family protein [Pseudomonadota bacterium]
MTPPSSDVILERMMSLHPKRIDLTLDRVWRLLTTLNHPERVLPPVIHIAGTNGKGSTVAMLRAGIEGAGQTVHAYTSPHLVRFHERIRVAGSLISEARLTDILDECWDANNREPITYFEITTVAAILAFARSEADWTLLEVGLGGRLDATNVVERPALTVITSVDIDHQQFLGETQAEIAFEKAGILKPGVPCIVGPQHASSEEVIERQAARVQAPLLIYGQHWHVWEERERLIFQDETGLLDLPLPRLRGAHQIQNAGMVLAGLRLLGFDETTCEHALLDADWPARFQRLRRGPLVEGAGNAEIWLDGGHNASAGRALASLLKDLPKKPTFLVSGMLKTKDPKVFFAPMADLVDGLFAVDIPDENATLPAEDTAAAGREVGIESVVAEDPPTAVAAIVARQPGARILICGSLYLAGRVLAENG